MAAKTADSSVSLTTGVATLYDPAADPHGRAKKIRIMARAANTNIALINVGGLHTSTEFMGLGPGHWAEFGDGQNPIVGIITAKSDTSTAVIDFGVVSR